jgi:predicted 3-demethylubiquinone-9 3-methyltransferase (glyoxalase superfamily)
MANLKHKITPHLWYDKEAVEAAKFYTSVFPDSKILHSVTLHDTPSPSGDTTVVDFQLLGQRFKAINGGPEFKFNEAISLMVSCDSQKEIDTYWTKLSAHPESEQCGWLKDRFGLSW